MNEKLIHEIAEQIVKEEILGNWIFYLLILAVSIISAFVSSYITGYARTRGQNLATKADFNQLSEQVRKTTITTEEIKTSIAHTDWSAREWKKLRKIKLEELLSTVYEIHEWFRINTNYRLFNSEIEPNTPPFMKIRMLVILYFIEDLSTEIDALENISAKYKLLLINAHEDITKNAAQLVAITNKIQPEILNYEEQLREVQNVIEMKASAIMKKIADVDLT